MLASPLALALLAGCRTRPEPLPTPTPGPGAEPATKAPVFTASPERKGLGITLSDLDPPAEGGARAPAAPAEVLGRDAVARLLARAPDLEAEEGDRQAFALRPATHPPPRAGATVEAPFPPPPGPPPPAVTPGAPKLVRSSPEGEVPMAPAVSLTFDQPMVALTSRDAAAARIPATISPEPPGRWRWLGTKTLMFDPEPRLPMATEFVVRVPGETVSASGLPLGKPVELRFATPPPTLRGYWPSYGPQPLDPTILLRFDQRVDPAAVLAKARISGDAVLRLATEAEAAAAAPWAGEGPEGSLVALVPVGRLSPDTSYTVTIPAGTPSAEGPRTSTGDQAFAFATYSPLDVVAASCWSGEPCPPEGGLYVEFDNPIDPAGLDPAAWKLDPPVPGLQVLPQGQIVTLQGAFTGRTLYTVTVPGSVKDTFGQALGRDVTRQVRVGPAQATLTGPPNGLVVLDPQGAGKLSVWSTNHPRLRVTVHEVGPADWEAWGRWQQTFWYDDARPGPLPGRRVADLTVETGARPDALVETAIDLAPYLGADARGQFVVAVEPVQQPRNRWERQYVHTWVEVTNVGLVAFADQERMVAWASDLATGAPLAGVALALGTATATTGADGTATLPLPTGVAPVLEARAGDDLAVLPYAIGSPGNGWVSTPFRSEPRLYLADDRGLYRPGETARVKGWLRRLDHGPEGDVAAYPASDAPLGWALTSVTGRPLASGEARLSRAGGFDVTVPIPADAELGPATLRFTGAGVGADASHPLRIEEFRRPEFEVSAAIDDGPHLLGLDARVDVSAAYYAGGGLAAAETTWTVFAAPGHFVPPGMSDWAYGTWTPWWIDGGGRWGGDLGGERVVGQRKATTDAAGGHHLGIHFQSMDPPRPWTVRAEAAVMDVNRQAWTAHAETLVHPASRYVGLKSGAAFVDKGEPLEVDLAVTDLDGKPADAASLEVSLARLGWGHRPDGSWGEIEEEVSPCEARLDADRRAHCTFPTDAGGSYRVLARITDPEGRANESELRLWVSGAETVPAREVALEELTLIPEKGELAAGEAATVLVQSPFWPAEGTLVVRRDGIERAERFSLAGPTTTLSVPIDETLVPGFELEVHVVGAATRLGDDGKPRPELPRRVAHAGGQVTFSVPPARRALGVTVAPAAAALSPGGDTVLDVAVVGADGAPVAGAEVAVVVVDESVLALTGYRLPDPVALFYGPRGGGVGDWLLRSYVALGNPAAVVAAPGFGAREGLGTRGEAAGGGGFFDRSMELDGVMDVLGGALAKNEAAPMQEQAKGRADNSRLKQASLARTTTDAAPSEPNGPAIALRTEFGALALFAPDVTTGPDGTAQVPLKLPDSLTRYRVMVVAADATNRFGSAESAVTARLPLMVRPSAPRFLNFGDQAEIPVVLQNQTDGPLVVEVAARASHLALTDAIAPVLPDLGDPGITTAGRRVTVPANDRVEVRFPAATLGAGTARLQLVASAGDLSDAADVSFPVWTPATTEAFATYGALDAGATVIPVEAPPGSWVQFGGLEVSTSSTQLQALTDAVLALQRYPYDCNEQIASRVLGVAALRDVLSAFGSSELPPPEALEATVRADLEKLAARQHWNGGWSFWRKGDETWPHLSIHVANAYARARAKGYAVPEDAWQRSVRHLQSIESYIPWWYSEESRVFLRAYAVDVLRRMGSPATGEARSLYKNKRSLLSIDGLAFLLPTLHEAGDRAAVDEILREFANRSTETAGTAHFVTSYSDGAQVLLHSDRRADGIVLEALMETGGADGELVDKVVRGLLAHRRQGHWANTQEDAFVLLALDRYFRTVEGETPDFVARVWLGDGFLSEHAFRGRTTERAEAAVPMGYLTERAGPQDLVLGMEGAEGRLYYRVGLRYAPKDLRLLPADEGFAVERTYVAVDDPGDVTRDAEGVWHVRAGARVRVELSMANASRRYHVALVDPLPGGFEAQNPTLATTGTVPNDTRPEDRPSWWWWTRSWHEHEMLRDDRVEAFTSLLWDGVHEYAYVARATTPGRFVVPPTKAEEMYAPETFGRAATDLVVIE